MSEKEDDTVTLVIEETSIDFSKAELASLSEYFEVMFTQNFAEKDKHTIPLKNVSVKDFLATLEIAKNKEKPITSTDSNEVLSILKTADKYLFTAVQNKCAETLERLVSVDSVLEVWQIAERLNLKRLLVKARYLAVTEFETVRKTGGFVRLDSAYLFRFLANTSLLCDNEMNVFEAGMHWLVGNPEESVDKEEVIYMLLTCLDYCKLSDSDIMEIQNNNFIKKSQNLSAVLQYVVDARKTNISYVYATDVIDKANVLLNSKQRAKDGFPTFVYRCTIDKVPTFTRKPGKPTIQINRLHNIYFQSLSLFVAPPQLLFYFGVDNYELIDVVNMNGTYFFPAHGQGVFSYKQYIFFCGGEGRIGFEKWVRNVYVYDTIKEKFALRSKLPFVRRHFRLVICGKIAYFIGGYGEYRTSKSDRMFYYNYVTNEWSCELCLPGCTQKDKIMCSNLNGQLFVMVVNDIKNPKGYIFLEQTSTWKNIPISVNGDNALHVHAAIFYYNNSLFIKSSKLTELKFANDELTEISMEDIKVVNDCFLLDCCICNDTLYSLYETMSAETDKILEVFSMVTRTATIERVSYKSRSVFPCRYYNICKAEEYINDYFKVDS